MKRWWMRFWHHKGQCLVCGQWVVLNMRHDRPATWTARDLWVRCVGMVR